jgi:hypothetical protein
MQSRRPCNDRQLFLPFQSCLHHWPVRANVFSLPPTSPQWTRPAPSIFGRPSQRWQRRPVSCPTDFIHLLLTDFHLRPEAILTPSRCRERFRSSTSSRGWVCTRRWRLRQAGEPRDLDRTFTRSPLSLRNWTRCSSRPKSGRRWRPITSVKR